MSLSLLRNIGAPNDASLAEPLGPISDEGDALSSQHEPQTDILAASVSDKTVFLRVGLYFVGSLQLVVPIIASSHAKKFVEYIYGEAPSPPDKQTVHGRKKHSTLQRPDHDRKRAGCPVEAAAHGIMRAAGLVSATPGKDKLSR